MEPTVKKSNPGLTYGLIAGLIYVLITLGQYLGGIQAFMSPVGYGSFVILIVMSVLAGVKQKKLQGYLEFGEALKIVFTVFVIATLLQTLFSYILFNYIDIAFKEALAQEVMNKTESIMRKFGASDTQIDEALKNMQGKNQFSFGKIMLGYGVTCIICFIISLIIAAIIQKRRPPFENSFNQ
jgi:Protein of unknown function (DUF4199)